MTERQVALPGSIGFPCEAIKTAFKTSRECDNMFHDIGQGIRQERHRIVMEQRAHIDSFNPVSISSARSLDKNSKTTPQEKRQLRAIVGQFGWIAGMTRPDLAFGTLDIYTSQKHSKVEGIIKANKLLKLAKEKRLKLTFSKLISLEDIKLIVYQDARVGNQW